MTRWYRHADHLEQLVAAEPVDVDAHSLDDALEKLALVHENVADPLFDRLFDRVRVHVNRLALAEAVAAVGRLVLDGGIPPTVEMEYVGGGVQVEALAA